MRRMSDIGEKNGSQRLISNDQHEVDSAYASPPALNDNKSHINENSSAKRKISYDAKSADNILNHNPPDSYNTEQLRVKQDAMG